MMLAGAKKGQAGWDACWGRKESVFPPAGGGHVEESFGAVRFVFQSGNSPWLGGWAGPTYLLGLV